MKVRVIEEVTSYNLERALNNELEKISNKNFKIIDIKYKYVENDYKWNALIIYEDMDGEE